jgi:ribonuclease R
MPDREDILRLIRERVHHPATARELAKLLKIPREDRHGFKRDLKALTDDGRLLQIRGNRFGLPDKMDLIVGRLNTNPSGFGFVVPEGAERAPRAERQDIYIASHNLTEAMHGDRVVARIERQTAKGPEGRIIRVLERASDQIVGRYESDPGGLGFVVPFDRRVLTDVHVPKGDW